MASTQEQIAKEQTEDAERRSRILAGLREFIAFMESHPGAPLPCLSPLNAFVDTKEELAAAARAIGGHIQKQPYDGWYTLRKDFGAIRYDVNIEREKVCERVEVGTRTIAAQPERVLPATEETIEPVYDWKCTEILR